MSKVKVKSNLLVKSFAGVTGKQKAFFFSLLDNDYNIEKTCKQYGCGKRTFYEWLKKPKIRAYKDFVASLYTESIELVAWKRLMEQIEEGDVKAIRTYFEIKGKLKGNQTNVDAKNVQYTVKFGKPTGKDSVGRLSSAHEPSSNT